MWRVNGEDGALLAPTDRGLAYGDGVFRTLALVDGQPRLWSRQFARLQADASRLGLPCPDEALWRADIAALAQAYGDGVIKCVLTRGSAGRGYAPPEQPQVTRVVQWAAAPVWPDACRQQGVEVRVARLRLASQPALAGIKHLNRLENVLARAEDRDPRWAETLLLDQHEQVIEGSMSNVFWLRDGQWFTPRLDQCGVAGVMRDWLLDHLRDSGQPALETGAGLDALLQADEVVLCNSLIGLWPVRYCQGRQWQRFSAIIQLQAVFEGER